MEVHHPKWLRIAAIFGFLAVALGAIGAHALKDRLIEADMLDAWKTAALYHLAHSIVLLVLSLAPTVKPRIFGCFAAGIVLFSGSLYAMALTGIAAFGPVTPIGGVLLLVAWGMLAFSARSASSAS